MAAKPELLRLYMCTDVKPFTKGTTHRLIWLSEEENLATLIRTDRSELTKPVTRFYREVEQWIDKGLLQAVEREDVIPQTKLSDDELNKRYPSKKRKAKNNGAKPSDSYSLEYRKRWTPIIKEITPQLAEVWRGKISLSSIIEPLCEKYGVCLNDTYQVLYRFLANKYSERSIVPRQFNCGSRGEHRIGKGLHLGRKKNTAIEAHKPNDNFPLDDQWLSRIQDTYQMSVNEGMPGAKAYREFMNIHCVKKWEIIDGKLVPEYLPADQYPSKRQFLCHGPGGNLKQEIFYKKLTPLEFELNYRALDGYREPITTRTGLFARVDASPVDEYLVSVFNRNQTLAVCRAILVVEEGLGYIWGIHPTWRVNKKAARLATLNAASDKTPFCARHGIIIKPGDWYKHLHSEYIADRGEFNSDPLRETFSEINCSIEYNATGRCDQNGLVERKHATLHNHDSKASTRGRYRERGEKDPAKFAHKNIFEYTRQLIRRVLYHNNFQPVPHLLTTEMRQAGVQPTRRAILEYCMEQNYHHSHHYNEEDLVIEFCPDFDATVTRDGIYPIVKRNIDSGDEIMLKDLRYLGQIAEERNWLELARRNGRQRIKIRMNPNDPSKAWYQDPDEGLQLLRLASTDPLIGKLASLEDILHWESSSTIQQSDLEQQAERELAEIELQEKAENAAIIQLQKDTAKQASGTKKVNNTSAKNRKEALQQEIAMSGQSPIPVQFSPSQSAESVFMAEEPCIPRKPESGTTSPQTPNDKSNVIPFKTNEDSELNNLFDRWLSGSS